MNPVDVFIGGYLSGTIIPYDTGNSRRLHRFLIRTFHMDRTYNLFRKMMLIQLGKCSQLSKFSRIWKTMRVTALSDYSEEEVVGLVGWKSLAISLYETGNVTKDGVLWVFRRFRDSVENRLLTQLENMGIVFDVDARGDGLSVWVRDYDTIKSVVIKLRIYTPLIFGGKLNMRKKAVAIEFTNENIGREWILVKECIPDRLFIFNRYESVLDVSKVTNGLTEITKDRYLGEVAAKAGIRNAWHTMVQHDQFVYFGVQSPILKDCARRCGAYVISFKDNYLDPFVDYWVDYSSSDKCNALKQLKLYLSDIGGFK